MLSELRGRLIDWCADSTVFAAVDGAGYDDLPSLLRERHLVAGSLFREPCDLAVMKDGPFLIRVRMKDIDTLLSLPEITENAVFWSAPGCTGHAFWRHLRTVMMSRIPSTKVDGNGRRMRRAMFRHQDPAVMARTLPVLTPAQRARLFGPALALLVCLSEELKEVRRQVDWPEPARGLLTFTPQQIQAMAITGQEQSFRTIAAFLRRNGEREAEGWGEQELLDYVRRMDSEGRAWGLRTEAGLGRFTWLNLMSRNEFAKQPDVRNFVTTGKGTADERIEMLMEGVAKDQLMREFKA